MTKMKRRREVKSIKKKRKRKIGKGKGKRKARTSHKNKGPKLTLGNNQGRGHTLKKDFFFPGARGRVSLMTKNFLLGE